MPFRDTPMDPLTRQTFARSIADLAEEFRGIFSLETVERYVDESIDRMSGARVVDFIPCSSIGSAASGSGPWPRPRA
jgi:hypothetical protein